MGETEVIIPIFFLTFATPYIKTTMNFKKISLLVVILIIVDQILKFWVKTHMQLEESIMVIPDWFQLRFVENKGAAFGMHIATSGSFDWGKLLLVVIRLVLVVGIGWVIHHLVRRRQATPKGVIVALAVILAGAIGNIIDSAFYGLIFSESTPMAVAHLGDGYGGFMMGKVVDMFYFPLFTIHDMPGWLGWLSGPDGVFTFFAPVFNVADSYISVAVVYLAIFQWKYFK